MGWSPDRLCSLLGALDARTDADLLGRFVAGRDGDAFAALVRRHGSMVMGVCRRVLRDEHGSEDAFQATFLVLARKARSVRRRCPVLAAWLYGVAYRTASEVRRAAVVRRAKEAKAAGMRDPYVPAPDGQPDLRDLLDRELHLLPDVYRAAVVLCDLEGLSRKEAAGRLGWAEGTLSGRLFRARALLAGRLSRYGLAVSGAAIVTASRNASAAVPAGLMATTTQVGVLVAAGEAVAIVASAPVAALTEGVMKAMLLTKLKGMTAGLMVACAVTATGLSGWTTATVEAQNQPTAGGRAAPRDPDKDRIAQLERERKELLLLVVDLKARLADLESSALRLREDEKTLKRKAEVLDTLLRKGAPAADPITPLTRPSDPLVTPLVPGTHPTPGPVTKPLLQDATPGMRNPLSLPSTSAASGQVATRVYPVDDLAGDEKQAEVLVRLVQRAVEPRSWEAVGGEGVAEYYGPRKALVVRQTEAAHRQVEELLGLLRGTKGGKSPTPGAGRADPPAAGL